MPCIQIKTNVSVNQSQAEKIKTALGQGIGYLPGKCEDWLMVSIQGDCQMYFSGKNNCPIAITEVKLWGTSVDQAGAQKLTGVITEVLDSTLGVTPNRMYIKYEALPDWAFNGSHL